MRLWKNSPTRKGKVVPFGGFDLKHTDSIRAKISKKLLPIWSGLVHELNVSSGEPASKLLELAVLDEQKGVCGQAYNQDNLNHKGIIPFLIILASMLFYWTGGMDTYTLPKITLIATLATYHTFTSRLSYGPDDCFLGAYLFVLLISSIFATYPIVAFFGQYNHHATGFLPTLLVVLCYLVGRSISAKTAQNTMLFACFTLGLIGLLQYLLHIAIPYALQNGRVYSTIGAPIYLAGMLGIGASMAVARQMYGLAACLLICIIPTASRVGYLSALVGCATVILQDKEDRRLKLLILSLVTLSGLFISTKILDHSKSDDLRSYMNYAAIQDIKKHNLLGIGPEQFMDTFERYRRPAEYKNFQLVTNAHCHNSVLEMVLSVGFVGLAVFIFWLVLVFSRIVSPCSLAMLTATIAYSMVQPLTLPMKCAISVVLGASIPGFDVTLRIKSLIKFLAIILCIVFAVMLLSTRIGLVAVQTGDAIALTSAARYYPPMMEKIWKR